MSLSPHPQLTGGVLTLALTLVLGATAATTVLMLAHDSPLPIALASGVVCLLVLAWVWLVAAIFRQRRTDIALWRGKRIRSGMTVALVLLPVIFVVARELGWISANLYHLRSSTSRKASFTGGKPRASLFRIHGGVGSVPPEAFEKGFYAAVGGREPDAADAIAVQLEGLPYGECLTPFIKTFSIRAEAAWPSGTKSVSLSGRLVGPVSFNACMELLGAEVGQALAK